MDSELFLQDFFYQGCQLIIELADMCFSSSASSIRGSGVCFALGGRGELFSQKLLMHVKKSGLYSTDGGANGIFQAGEECDRLFISKYP